jgi:transcriptional regulator with XRE-family HTH domain
LTQGELAFFAGVSRGAICQLEEGRTQSVNPGILRALAERLYDSEESLADKFEKFKSSRGAHRLDARAMNALSLPVEFIHRYRGFRQWRQDVAPSATALASMLKTNRSQVVRFENGEIPMPKAVYRGLIREFGLSEEYVAALMLLDERS